MTAGHIRLVEMTQFVVSECARFQQLVAEKNLSTLDRLDWLTSLPHPSGTGSLICGREASKVIHELTVEAAISGRLRGAVSLSNLRKELERQFVFRFLKEARPVDRSQVDRMISAAVKAAKRHCKPVTHLIPCHLMNTKEPESFPVGPVTFHNRSSMRRLLMGKLKDGLQENRTEHARRLQADAVRYYRNFRWTAEITIFNCDAETSEELAKYAVTGALDCMHLLLSATHTRRMQIGGHAVRADRRAKLCLSELGKLEASTSFSYLGEVTYPEDWRNMVFEASSDHWLQLFGLALDAAINPALKRPMGQRFLDAAQWFGEATRDPSPATKIVKYVTALERMLMTDERDDIASLISKRVAALCVDHETSRADWEEQTKAIYDWRSRLVHGSISPRTYDLNGAAIQAENLVRQAILRTIELVGPRGLQSETLGTKQLAKLFGSYIEYVDLYEEDFRARPRE